MKAGDKILMSSTDAPRVPKTRGYHSGGSRCYNISYSLLSSKAHYVGTDNEVFSRYATILVTPLHNSSLCYRQYARDITDRNNKKANSLMHVAFAVSLDECLDPSPYSELLLQFLTLPTSRMLKSARKKHYFTSWITIKKMY